MNGRMAVMAAIVSWVARGTSPIDGMYWADAKAAPAKKLAQQDLVATGQLGRYAHCG